MSKSGEIIRIGHGNYSFLCIHCGFNFVDIKEILAHIDYHFDMMDTKVTNADTGNYFDNSINIRNHTIHPIQQLFVDEVRFPEGIRSEIKVENDEEIWPDIKTDENVAGHQYDIVLSEDVRKSPRMEQKRTKQIVKKKRKFEIKSESDESADQAVNCQQCPLCELSFVNSRKYQKHLRTVHNMNKVFECYICGYHCKNLTALKSHLRTAFHSGPNCYQCELEPIIANELDARPHKCLFCKEWLENHLLFRRHFKNVHQQDVAKFFSKRSNCSEFSCYVCKRDFPCKYYLKTHMIVHTGNKPFVCDVCGKRYRTKPVLKRHLSTHEGGVYTCEDCGKTFSYLARLRIHLYSHRTELNYKCTVCSKAFKIQKYLSRHMKIHREEKTFPCRYCEKRFTFGTGRRAHEISQHNII